MVDEARAHALRQYNDADGHFSLVRFVGNGSRDPNYMRGAGILANESLALTGISILQTS